MTYGGPRCSICARPLHVYAIERDAAEDRDWNRWCTHCDGNGELPERHRNDAEHNERRP